VRAEERERVAGALGRTVTGWRTLAGGFSHETCLLELGSDRAVVRLGGTDPAIEAAVMAAAGAWVPVPEVLLVLPASAAGPDATGGAAPAGGSARPAMVLEYVTGNLLSEVLATADEADGTDGTDGKALANLGAEVGRIFAGIAAVTFGRAGFFADAKLAVGEMPPWSEQLPGMAVTCMERVPPSRLDPATRRAWTQLCAAHAPALTRIDDQARLVHADANPKNVLVSRVDGGWRVDAVLDWEFSFSGCPYADFANMTRFEGSYPAGFVAGFRAGFGECGPADLARPDDWAYLGRVMDMFALSDLVTRPDGHPVADQAAGEIRRWIAEGIPR
jgi:aminoglycoside phosphotransferase (APT) family kinase protein